MAGAISVLAVLAVALGSAAATPARCGDLAAADVYTVSHAGAHHYLALPVAGFGLGALSYRQFSDWHPGGPLFPELLRLYAAAAPGANATVSAYEWRPDYATASGALPLPAPVDVWQRVYYANDTIVARLGLRSRAAADVPLVLRSASSASAAVDAAAVNATTLRVTARFALPNLWGYPPSNTTVEWYASLEAADGDAPPATPLLPAPGEFGFALTLPAGRQLNLTLRFGPRPPAAAAPPEAETTARVDAWLADLPPPRTNATDAHTRRMYYTAWYQFWYNTEHAAGDWPRPIVTPSKSTYARGIWLWDTAFHAFALLQGQALGPQLAASQVDVLVEASAAHGHLPREIWVGGVSTDVQPPGVLTWAALRVYERDGDAAALGRAYAALAQNNAWFYANRDPDGDGLCEWAGTDSGWDTSPRWDNGTVEAVDLNCWLALDQQYLAQMAAALGRPADAQRWLAAANATAARVRAALWDEAAGLYFDRDPRTRQLVRVVTPATYWALLAGVATPAQAGRMAAAATDPQRLGTPFPLPSVGRGEPAFDPTNYWRGPTWINVNWLAALGLRRYGLVDLARELQRTSLALVGAQPVPREYYDPLTGAGLGALNYMWTGALYIVMLNDPF